MAESQGRKPTVANTGFGRAAYEARPGSDPISSDSSLRQLIYLFYIYQPCFHQRQGLFQVFQRAGLAAHALKSSSRSLQTPWQYGDSPLHVVMQVSQRGLGGASPGK